MTMNFNLADKMAVMSTSKRQDLDRKGVFGRAAALIGNGPRSDSDPKEPKAKPKNTVAAEMKKLEGAKEYEPIWEQVQMASRAAQESCQKSMDGVESKKERDDRLVKTLNDLIAVIEAVRDSRKEVIAARSQEEEDHPELV